MAPGSWFILPGRAAIALVVGLAVITAPAAPASGFEAPEGEVGRVAYVAWHDIAGTPMLAGEVHTMRADGADRRRVTDSAGAFLGTGYDFEGDPYPIYTTNVDPAWTPDGSMLAYRHRATVTSWQVRIVDLDTGDDRLLLDDWTSSMISWSPDGRRVAYGNRSGVWIADADGSDARLLIESRRGLFPWSTDGPETAAEATMVHWSPDGARIAFIESTHFELVAGFRFLSIVPVEAPHEVVRVGVTSGQVSLDWASDGQSLVVAGLGTGLSSVDLSGAMSPLTADWGEHPAWSPDGREILYVTDQLVSYDTEGGTTTVLDADFSGWNLRWQHVRPHAQAVGLVDPDTGVWRVPGTDGVVRSFYYGNPGDVPFLGDWDCDGIATPGLFRTSDAFAYLRNANSSGIADIRFFFGNPSDIPLAGDFDGDGCDTLSIYRPSEQRFYIINELGEDEGGLGAAEYSFVFGNPGDQPVVGDWDGDGVDEIGLHRESTGFFYYRETLTTGIADGALFFGDPGDRFVAGDWGVVDGADTPAVFRPGDVTFYFRHSLDQGIADDSITWAGAESNWRPVSGGG